MLLTSTAGHADSVVLRAFYDRLRRQASGEEAPDRAFYAGWWQADDPDVGLDWPQIKRANPGLGDGRLTKQAITSEYSILPTDSWQRERLNHFVDTIAPGAFNARTWAANRVQEPLAGATESYVLGVDVHPGWERATITVAAMREDGRVGVEVHRDLRGGLTADDVIEAAESFPAIDRVLRIIVEGSSGLGPAAMRRQVESGYPWELWKPGLVTEACMDVSELIIAGKLAVDDPLLDAQIIMAARRDVGSDGAFRFSRKDSLGPIDGVMAMTFAVHGILLFGAYPTIG